MVADKHKQNITVQITKKFENISVNLSRLKKLVKTVCTRFKISKATVSIMITGDAEIRRVNRRFLNRGSVTDCISFNLSDKTNPAGLFELIVNGELAVRQARQRGHTPEAELALYITHGLLHNLGFNDLKVREAKKMHSTEDKILQQFGYGLIYNSSGKEKA
jgi:probable rRNA maturation factor